MEAMKFLENTSDANWEYDEEADTLYLSVGEPREALSLDVGDGTIIRYDQNSKEVVGITVVGLRERFLKELKMVA